VRQNSLHDLPRVLLYVATILVCLQPAVGQDRCLSQDEIKNMLAQVNSPRQLPLNIELRDELLKLKKKDQERLNKSIAENRKTDALMDRIRASRDNNAARLCTILKQYGWPTSSLVGKDGVDAAFHLLRESVPQLKIDLLQVIIAVARMGEISRPTFASYIDRLRLDAGLKQVFGTQATPIDGFLVLFPIEAEAQVDMRRKQFELPPLADFLRFLEAKYRLPLVKSTGALINQFSDSVKSSIANTSTGLFEGQTVTENDVLRVDTNLVSVNVSVYSKQLRTHVGTLVRENFTISEDNHDEKITFFAATDVPFDLVLLIDLSGSTFGKRKLILDSTQSFIQAARPSDRLAIVTFSDKASIASPLTDNRAQLLASLDDIEAGKGPSFVWDALKFTLDQVVGPKTLVRRRAVVFMTDGYDNALDGAGGGSVITFADLLETVRGNDALIIPIYLDSEGELSGGQFARIYENARKTLRLLAEESGGRYYKARKIEDLNGVYAQVIEDLGKVYSLGYRPTNEKRDGTWRTVKIQMPGKPNLIPRARPGYYAN